MTRETFETIFNLCAESEHLINVGLVEEISTFNHYCYLEIGPLLIEKLKAHYTERLLDGANLIDEYRDVCVFAQNWEDRHEQDSDQEFQIAFWQAAEVLIDIEFAKDEEHE